MSDPNAQPDPRRSSEPSWYGSAASGGGSSTSGSSAPRWPDAPHDPAGPHGGHPRAAPGAAGSPYGPGAMPSPAPAYAPGPTPPGYAVRSSATPALSLTSMILGIFSLIGGFALLAPPVVGVVLGHMGLRREENGRGMAIAGLVMNYLTLALMLGFVLIMVLFVVGLGAAGGSSGY